MPTIEISEKVKKRVDAVQAWLFDGLPIPANYDEIMEFMIDGLDRGF